MTPQAEAVTVAMDEYQARLVTCGLSLLALRELIAKAARPVDAEPEPPKPPRIHVLPEPFTLSDYERRERRLALLMDAWRNWTTYDHLTHRASGVLLRGHLVHRMGSHHGTSI